MPTATRVIKNTGYLYIKMGVSVFISLYTTRLVLTSLGASDFGIFNIVGGAIAMLGFLNSTMANATQRFMSYAEGGGDLEQKRQVFNVSILLHVAIALLTVLILLALLPWMFHSILNIPQERIFAAKYIYYSLIVSTMLTIVNVPYDAVMNAHENMLYYSIIGIFESLLRLGVAFVCVYTQHDKLIIYGILMALIPLITLSIMKFYCHKKYQECIIAPRKYHDIRLIKQIASFSCWNFLTAISSLFTAQGIGIVLNHFFGTVLNAAQAVANQLNGQLSAFSANMMKALNPVIVKDAGAGDINAMNRAVLSGCKFSTFLTAIFAVPFIIEMPYILHLWLKDVPEWTIVFCRFQLIQTMLLKMADSASTAVYATGNIKRYAIYKSIMNIIPLVLVYIAFRLGGSPVWLYIPMIAVWAIGGNIVIIHYASHLCGLSVRSYGRYVLAPCFSVIATMFIAGYLPLIWLDSSIWRALLCAMATTIGMFVSMWSIGLTSVEREVTLHILSHITHKNTNPQ